MAKGTVPPTVQAELTKRLAAHAAKKWKETCARVEVRFRGRFAQVDIYRYDEATRKVEEMPTHLCRLEYEGHPDRWGFAFYKYSEERYERSFLFTGSMGGTPEDCFDCAGLAYLS